MNSCKDCIAFGGCPERSRDYRCKDFIDYRTIPKIKEKDSSRPKRESSSKKLFKHYTTKSGKGTIK